MNGVEGGVMKRLLVFLLCISVLAVPVRPEDGTGVKSPLPLDKKFYTELSKTPPVSRNDFWESKINVIVIVRGVIISIDKTPRFKKNYRVVLADRESDRLNIRITYHLYVDSRTTVSMLKEHETLEFSGQILAFTPTTSRRDGYIIDILFEKGATLVE
jgi:hypothetical protein